MVTQSVSQSVGQSVLPEGVLPECDEYSQGKCEGPQREGVAHGVHDPELAQDASILLLQGTQHTHTSSLTNTIESIEVL